jgi:hypothetical protein
MSWSQHEPCTDYCGCFVVTRNLWAPTHHTMVELDVLFARSDLCELGQWWMLTTYHCTTRDRTHPRWRLPRATTLLAPSSTFTMLLSTLLLSRSPTPRSLVTYHNNVPALFTQWGCSYSVKWLLKIANFLEPNRGEARS